MNEVTITDAKARLSSILDEAVEGRPTVVTRNGRKEAVVMSYDHWQATSGPRRQWELLLSAPIEPGDIPERDRRRCATSISELTTPPSLLPINSASAELISLSG